MESPSGDLWFPPAMQPSNLASILRFHLFGLPFLSSTQRIALQTLFGGSGIDVSESFILAAIFSLRGHQDNY